MVPALVFQKVVISYHEMRGPRMSLLLLGPPCGQQHILIRLRGGGPKCLKICSKSHFLLNSRCNAGPGFWSKFEPFVVGPRFRPAFRASSLRGGVPKCLKISSKSHFLSYSRCNAGPGFCSKFGLLVAGPRLRPAFRASSLRVGGQNLFKKVTF